MQNELLIVRYISVNNCFVHLPNDWLQKLSSSNNCVIKVLNNEINYYFSYLKSQPSPNNTLCISATFAKYLNITEGTTINVSSVSDAPIVSSIIVTAQCEEDLTIVKLRAEKIQEIILHQINIVSKNQIIVIWLSKSIYVRLIVNSIVPNIQYGKLEQFTEVHVLDTIGRIKEPSNETMENSKVTLPMNNINSCVELLNNYQDKVISPIFRVCFIPNLIDININDPFNIEIESIYNIFITLSQSMKYFPNYVGNKYFFCNFKILPGKQQREIKKNFNFIKTENSVDEISELLVRVIIIENIVKYVGNDNEDLMNKIATINNNNIIVSQRVKKLLHLQLGDKIILKPIAITERKVNQINLYPSDKNITREMFENYFREHFPAKKILLNSGTKIFLSDQISCKIQLFPETYTYALLHENEIKDINICLNDSIIPESSDSNSENNCEIENKSCHHLCLEIMEQNLSECRTIFSMSLNTSTANNSPCNSRNILICGNIGSGKTTLCKILNEEMQQSPNFFYTRKIECKKLKGKKFEVINKLFINIMNDCQYHQPSILFIDDLDSITSSSSDEENSPDFINAARISDNIISIITNYQSTNLINILSTCINTDKLGNQLRSLRGVKLFQTVLKIPNLSLKNRCDILKATLTYKLLLISNEISWDYYGNKTEGWTAQDLIDLAEKAAFIAWKREIHLKIDNSNMTVNNEDLLNALNCCKPISLHGVTLYSGVGNNWSDIGGLTSVKNSLIQLLQWPLIYSGLFKNSPIKQQSGVLLYGMPGTGKTMLAGAIAKECGLNFINIKGPELLSKYIGASEEAVRNIFYKAQCAKPCVLFFDEFESFAPRRGHDSTGVTDRVVNQLLTEFDGVEGREGVAIVAASSRPDLLDPALLRPGRLDKSLLCSLPTKDEREKILEVLCNAHGIDISELDLKILAENSVNFTGADLNAVLTQAQMNLFAENSQLISNENLEAIEGIKISQSDLVKSLEVTQPSLTAAEIAKFHKIYSKFSKGDGFTEDLLKNLKSTLA
ncbi:hypothetical protein PV328_006353 [Microctonus aethiopoides]|uniref:Peroxisomal ATPase PEX1 n=1 Tax=Microctonus aethiopoides TaxID=144406 RepID=A0AA39KTE7_9HYME|nr:hypothetical protein PV328_006353 [Microctonus aethiopoides]